MGITGHIKKLFYSRKEKRHHLVGPAKLWKMKQDFQIEFLKENGLKPTNRLLDIGCGTLRGGIPIIDYLEKGNYTGIDVRQEVIEEAFKELQEEGLENKQPHILQFDQFNQLELENSYDVLFAFSVLIHLQDHILTDCMEFASRVLKSTGKFYANVNLVQRDDSAWQGFPVVFRSLEFYQENAARYGMSVRVMDELKNLGHDSNMKLGDQQVMIEITRTKT